MILIVSQVRKSILSIQKIDGQPCFLASRRKMEFQDSVNTILLSMTHYFNVSRMPELAIANILALMMMNFPSQNKHQYAILNGTFTYLMGYTFFLQSNPSSGVYMFLLGVLCIGTGVADKFQEILEDWNDRFRVQKEIQEDDDDDDDADEADEAEAPNPTMSEVSSAPAPQDESIEAASAPAPQEAAVAEASSESANPPVETPKTE